MSKTQDDEVVMNLVELTLAMPAEQRDSYLRDACVGDQELFDKVLDYISWDSRMQGFLMDPLFSLNAPECQFEPGELLEHRFRIVREVAQGGMGIVYEAVDEKLRKRIALKCAKNGFRQRLSPEVRHASEISHPNVCRIFEIHTASTPQGEIDFLTMEFLDGETLSARLKRGRPAPAEARAIAIQLCQGLAEAHRNRVVHGDLKSNNVILTKAADGAVRAVITDFGLARGDWASLDEGAPLPGSSEMGGTPDYMAPELWKGGKASAASDIYALGVILYELAAGRVPFSGSAWKEKAVLELPPAHSKWDAILARCLDPEPVNRPEANQVAEALQPSRQWRWWPAATASVALAVGVGGITYQRASAPEEAISLALLPLESDSGNAATAAALSQDAFHELARLKGGKRARLSIVPLAKVTSGHVASVADAQSKLGATHVLHGTLSRENGQFVVHAFLTDTRTQANKAGQEFSYGAKELRYAPLALAAMTTATLHLTPPAAPAVNSKARPDYLAGLAYMPQDSTIDKALPMLTRAVDANTDSALTWAALAEAYYFKFHSTNNQTWLDGAKESLRQAQLRDLDLAPVHRVAGMLLFISGSYGLAEAEYQRSIELDPMNAQTFWRLGQAYESNHRLEEAVAALRNAVQLDPNHFKMHLQLGAFYLNHGQSTKAVKQLEICVRLAPNEPEAHFALGTAYTDAGRLGEAERELRAATVPGGPASAFNNLADALIARGKDREAIPVLVSALRQFEFGDLYLWWTNLGDAYRRTDQPDASARAYRKGLEAAETELARNLLDGRVRSCSAYLCARLNDRSRAHSEIALALKLSPEDKNTREMTACAYEALGEHEEAVDILQALSVESLTEVVRSPNLAGLIHYPRFIELLTSRHIALGESR